MQECVVIFVALLWDFRAVCQERRSGALSRTRFRPISDRARPHSKLLSPALLRELIGQARLFRPPIEGPVARLAWLSFMRA